MDLFSYVRARDRPLPGPKLGEADLGLPFGGRFLEQDKAARLFLYRGDLQKEFTSYHPQAGMILAAFARGINAYIDWLSSNPGRHRVGRLFFAATTWITFSR